MKRATIVLLISFIIVIFAGLALAAEMSGEVTAVDAAKGTLTLKSGTAEAGFNSETALIKDVKVGDHVTVKYKEEDGKKIVTKVAPKVAPMKRDIPGFKY